MANKSHQRKSTQCNSWPQFARDIIIHSINKGVLFPLLVFLIFLIPVFKMDSKDSYKFINSVLCHLVDYSLLGWLLLIVTIYAGMLILKRNRKKYSEFMKIAGEEKTKLQQLLNRKEKLGSSNRR